MLTWKILDEKGHTRYVAHGEREVGLVCTAAYQPGDRIVLEIGEQPCYLWVQLDECLGGSLLYMTAIWTMTCPLARKKYAIPRIHLRGNVIISMRVWQRRRRYTVIAICVKC